MFHASEMAFFDNDTDPRPRAQVVVQSALMAVIMLSATVGNVLVLFALGNFRVLRSKTAVFIANLAVADLAVGVTCMPFILGSGITNRWIGGDAFCTINAITNVCFCVASILTLAGIALDRYFAIVHPFRYLELMSPRRVALILAWIWIESIILGVLPVLGSRSKYFHNWYVCVIDWENSLIFTCINWAVGFVAPLAVMCYCYFHILKVARIQSRKIGDMESLGADESAVATRRARKIKRDAKAAIKLLILIGNFMVCWCPFFVGVLCLAFKRNECQLSDAVFTSATWLGMANSGLNPLIYGLLDRRLRQAVWLIVRCKIHQRLDDPNN